MTIRETQFNQNPLGPCNVGINTSSKVHTKYPSIYIVHIVMMKIGIGRLIKDNLIIGFQYIGSYFALATKPVTNVWTKIKKSPGGNIFFDFYQKRFTECHRYIHESISRVVLPSARVERNSSALLFISRFRNEGEIMFQWK